MYKESQRDVPERDNLPVSIHTEKAVLGAMLLDTAACIEAVGILEEEDFSLDSHRRVFHAMQRMSERQIAVDLITLAAQLDSTKDLTAIGGFSYISSLTEGIPYKLNIEDYMRIIRHKSMARSMAATFESGMSQITDPGADVLEIASHIALRLGEVTDRATSHTLTNIAGILNESFGSIDELIDGGKEISGLRTHYDDFDRLTSGLQPSDLIILAARPSMGKTALALNIAQNAAMRDNKVVAFFSLEMSKESLLRRMLASEAMVSSRRIQQGFIGREERYTVTNALEKIIDSKLFIDDSVGLSLTELRSKARRLQQTEGLDLIVIDYLQLMRSGQKVENRTQEVSMVSRGLKGIAKELGVPVMALSQLSRGNDQRKGNHRPLLSDLRESGSIEQDADLVCFIHRQEYYDRDNEDVKGKADIIVAKQRNGPTATVQLAYMADFTRFENLAQGSLY